MFSLYLKNSVTAPATVIRRVKPFIIIEDRRWNVEGALHSIVYRIT